MNNKNKAIEEMAKIMEECCNVYDEKGNRIRNKCNTFDCEYYCDTNHVCFSYGIKEATALYNAGYRKVNDDEVVISKEEYANLSVKCDGKVCFTADEMVEQANKMNMLAEVVKTLKNLVSKLTKNIEQTRKETAREILQELSKMRTYGTKGDFLYKIDKLAEKYGVEVE